MCSSRASGIFSVEMRGGNRTDLLREGVRGAKPASFMASSSVVGVGGPEESDDDEAAADGDMLGMMAA